MKAKNMIYVGIDWAHTEHQVVVLDACGERLLSRRFEARCTKAQRELITLLRELGSSHGPLCIGIEGAALPLVDTLLEQGWPVWLVSPQKVDQMRKVASSGGAKDDERDADIIATMLPMGIVKGWVTQIQPRDPLLARLREFSRRRSALVERQTAAESRLHAALSRYWPAFLTLELNLSCLWVLAMWRHLRSPERARRCKAEPLQKLLERHRGRNKDAQGLLEVLRDNNDASSVEAESAQFAAEFAVDDLLLVRNDLKQLEARIRSTLAELEQRQREQYPERRHTDIEIWKSLPGMGPMLLAVLLSEAGELIAARDLESVRRLGGIAPVTQQSGAASNRKASMRYARNLHLSNGFNRYAGLAAGNNALDRERRQRLEEKSFSPGRIRRQLADGLLKVAFAMLRRDELYDDTKRVGARKALAENPKKSNP